MHVHVCGCKAVYVWFYGRARDARITVFILCLYYISCCSKVYFSYENEQMTVVLTVVIEQIEVKEPSLIFQWKQSIRRQLVHQQQFYSPESVSFLFYLTLNAGCQQFVLSEGTVIECTYRRLTH